MIYNTTGPVMMPPSGKFVYDKDGEKVEDYSRNGLIAKLTELRRANQKRIGNPATDIDKFLSGQQGYSAPIPVAATTVKQSRPRLIDRVNSWLMTRYAKLPTIQYVNSDEAKRRAVICIQCPKNKDWKGSCRTCNAESKREVERNIVIISQNKLTSYHDRLGACAITGQANKVAVWLSETFLKHRVSYIDNLPPRCWLKTL
jgi:hypothetical protein